LLWGGTLQNGREVPFSLQRTISYSGKNTVLSLFLLRGIFVIFFSLIFLPFANFNLICNLTNQLSTMPIDLRSDTVTRPTPAMLDVMMHARVGDDVFGEDPSINQLEKMAADLFGMEAALYCPSGTMSNQIAIKCHTQPGDEVICEKSSHVYIYEGGGIAFNSGSQVRAIDGDRGRITA
jgi:hypothetical protein